jgi:hypothetical protein
MTEIQLAFDIEAASCHQIIRVVNPDYDEESIIQGLKAGTLATTTWFGTDGFSWLEEIETGKQVGLIVSQEIDGEYLDYR